ncbi:MAG: class I SAM-dependent rRNA methyltransferase [Candidatus Sericytochromatia bacterium]|nr:class I SAM-dependent rRNA methyltransferase [Candidatus Tanganyikabacteria bacterium]
MTERPSVVLTRKGEERLRQGHPWVFGADVAHADQDVAGWVDVLDRRGRPLGVASYNPATGLCLRMHGASKDAAGPAWIRRRLHEALQLRQAWLPGAEAWRLVHGEADGLPAIVVDRYGPWLVVQSMSWGSDQLLPELVAALGELLQPQGILERSEGFARKLEGLEPRTGVLAGSAPEGAVRITEGDVAYHVDLEGGQKTGFFLDQRPNRARLATFAPGRNILNAFCYSGGFSLPAAKAGARHVTGIDIAADALALARRNACENGVEETCTWVEDNAFDHLRLMQKRGDKYDIVVLDPPAFTKNKASIPGAIRGYKEINLRGIAMVQPGGMLVTSSCSHHMDTETFLEVVAAAAVDAGRRIRVLDVTGPGPDHPSLPGAPESRYLKCVWAIVEGDHDS